MAGLAYIPVRQVRVNGSGRPYAGALAYFYAAGTTTARPTYTNSSLSVPHPNPVVANSAGVFPAVYLDPQYTYRCITQTSGGAAIDDEDNIPGTVALTAAVVGDAVTPTTQDERDAGVVPTYTHYDELDPRRYNGDSTGVRDSSSAIAAAIAVARGRRIPIEGTYKVGVLSLTTSVHFAGSGTLDGAGTTNSGFTVAADISHLKLEGVTFQNFDGYAFKANATTRVISSLQVTGCTFKDSHAGLFLNCVVSKAVVNGGNRFLNLGKTGGNYDTAGVWLGTNSYASQEAMGEAIVEGNIFNDIVGDDEVHGVIVYGKQAVIQGNTFRTINNPALTDCEAIYTKCRYAIIADNTLLDCDAGDNRGAIAVKGDLRGSTTAPQGFATQVRGNTIIGTSGATNGILIANDDVLVADNHIEGMGLYGIATLSLTNSNITIHGNKIRKHRGSVGIFSQASGRNVTITENTVDELLATQGTITSAIGIQVALNAACKSVTICDNRIFEDATSSATTNSKGIRLQTTVSGTIDTLTLTGNKMVVRRASGEEFGIEMEFRAAVSALLVAENSLTVPTDTGLPMYMDATSATHIASAKVDWGGGLGWGPIYNLNPGDIEAYHCGTTFTNAGASGTRTSVLPIATPGLWFRFIRTAAHALRVDPDGSEVIRGGGGGKYLELDADGESVTLFCFAAGTWEIVASNGSPAYEP
jgi:hypothetical protein